MAQKEGGPVTGSKNLEKKRATGCVPTSSKRGGINMGDRSRKTRVANNQLQKCAGGGMAVSGTLCAHLLERISQKREKLPRVDRNGSRRGKTAPQWRGGDPLGEALCCIRGVDKTGSGQRA